MTRRPSTTALELEVGLAERATSAGQGNRSRPRQHGDLATYQWGLSGKDRANGCRCDLCVEGNRAYKRRHARERYQSRTGGGFVALRTVRPHARRLLALGWQIKQVADRAQVMPSAVARIARWGAPDDDVKRYVATAILAIPAVAPHRLPRFEIDQAMLARASDIKAGRWTAERDAARFVASDEWKALAACADLDPDSMQPGRGDSVDACRALCAVCPVKGECGEAGLCERFGIWGGLSERERRVIRRRRGIRLEDDLGVEEVA